MGQSERTAMNSQALACVAPAQNRHIALVRGVNVGGHSLIKMAELRHLFEAAGCAEVVTHIQSGNVVFSCTAARREQVVKQIETRLETQIGPRTKVFVFTRAELEDAVEHNPFHPERSEHEDLCQFMFLSAVPEAARSQALMKLQGTEYRFHLHDKVLYYTYPKRIAGKRRNINL